MYQVLMITSFGQTCYYFIKRLWIILTQKYKYKFKDFKLIYNLNWRLG